MRKAVVKALATAITTVQAVREKVGHAILGDTPEMENMDNK